MYQPSKTYPGSLAVGKTSGLAPVMYDALVELAVPPFAAKLTVYDDAAHCAYNVVLEVGVNDAQAMRGSGVDSSAGESQFA